MSLPPKHCYLPIEAHDAISQNTTVVLNTSTVVCLVLGCVSFTYSCLFRRSVCSGYYISRL